MILQGTKYLFFIEFHFLFHQRYHHYMTDILNGGLQAPRSASLRLEWQSTCWSRLGCTRSSSGSHHCHPAKGCSLSRPWNPYQPPSRRLCARHESFPRHHDVISLAHQLRYQPGVLSAYRDVQGQAWLEELRFRARQVATELQRKCAHADHRLAIYTSDGSLGLLTLSSFAGTYLVQRHTGQSGKWAGHVSTAQVLLMDGLGDLPAACGIGRKSRC